MCVCVWGGGEGGAVALLLQHTTLWPHPHREGYSRRVVCGTRHEGEFPLENGWQSLLRCAALVQEWLAP